MRDFFMRAAKTDHSAHAQADLSRRWAHIYKKGTFSHVAAQILKSMNKGPDIRFRSTR